MNNLDLCHFGPRPLVSSDPVKSEFLIDQCFLLLFFPGDGKGERERVSGERSEIAEVRSYSRSELTKVVKFIKLVKITDHKLQS